MCQQTSEKPLTDPREPPKVALGKLREHPRAPSGPPSDIPRSPPEPPSRKYANGCRGSTNSGRPARAPGTGGHAQPPPLIVYVQTLSHSRSRLRPPPPPDPRGRRIRLGCAHCRRPRKRILRSAIENGPLRLLLRILRRRVQPAANDVEPR